MKSHLDLHAVPTAWRLVHGSWGISTGVGLRDRAGQDSGWSGPWRHVSPFWGGARILTGQDIVLAVGELAEGAARLRFLRLSRLASLIRGEGEGGCNEAGSGGFFSGLCDAKTPDISVVSWQDEMVCRNGDVARKGVSPCRGLV